MILEVKDLNAWYGKSHILRGVSFNVKPGEILAMLGRNGVGRSTTVKALMGDVEKTGEITFEGNRIDNLPTHEIARLGIGCVPEDRQVFPTLTVHQNLIMGLQSQGRDDGWTPDDAFQLFPRLAERAGTEAGSLSGGEQQLLTMMRTLMGNPKLILIDEPTEGLAPRMVAQVKDLILEIARRGTSVVLVEQKLTVALKIANRVLVMGHGSIVFEGTPADLAAREDVRRDYIEV
ncbi:amino acid/amide ABC transporter ATP-binding protein 2, HAAT family [Pseudosulfitobacter pseudonitzschiae]|uniref:Mannosyltransferase n=1 Tax=Pseudosulfitobacter pseudonitzschiae TaxID=1402135 RepID=A0A073IWY7_9RHOB|nr:ABC transporter ATP-binding protein [Pseudosulfitobacter pseudonitzschiae]KEJ94868.1 mannosyltransferase [Pseudosulfitobacter pseudonitzschiae]QKS07346.1 ABC transporter ATP-binding protein [Pseudosulfitobacter pseudonitzschiae]SHF95528.1 amino acid/amide ABC transporter ATP-binding protein 2, HAAT family [Pseudosulfitobacter pseudonitzschiae]